MNPIRYRGIVKGQTIILTEGAVPLADGTPVLVTPLAAEAGTPAALLAALAAEPHLTAEDLEELERAMRRRGLNSVEQLLEAWQVGEEDLATFPTLAARWKQETAHHSNVAKRALHSAYQEIIGMGERVVPLLLSELRREPDDWFWALHAITGANPVPAASRGNVQAMAEAWIQWGLDKGYKV
jgi:hypothetical protein